ADVSMAILLGWELYFAPKLTPPPAPVTETTQPAAPPNVDTNGPTAPVAVPSPEGQPVAAPPPAATETEAGRLKIATNSVQGSISLAGGRVGDIHLSRYRETTDPNSPPITLLTSANSPKPYYAEFGWIASD